jgi:hypothetical protein
MTEVTINVPEDRLPEFYHRFGDFLGNSPVQSGVQLLPEKIDGWDIPAWANEPDASQLLGTLWSAISPTAQETLRVLVDGALEDQPRGFTPEELLAITHHPKGTSGIAGVLGQVGHEIRRVGLPRYKAGSESWHYVWHWNRHQYSMSPTVATLFRQNGA